MNNYIDIDAVMAKQKVLSVNVAQTKGGIAVPSQYLLCIDYVKDVVVLNVGNTAIVCVLTTPIYMSSVRDKLTEKIIISTKKNVNAKDILVSYDTDMYYQATRANSNEDFNRILETMLRRK